MGRAVCRADGAGLSLLTCAQRGTRSLSSFHAKLLLGSFPRNFSDFRITCVFPTGNHRKGTGGDEGSGLVSCSQAELRWQ